MRELRGRKGAAVSTSCSASAVCEQRAGPAVPVFKTGTFLGTLVLMPAYFIFLNNSSFLPTAKYWINSSRDISPDPSTSMASKIAHVLSFTKPMFLM